MRGEAEQNCFELIKANLDKDIYFAMSHIDRDSIKDVFESASPNPDNSSFPDFVFNGGFIEHFRVTSSDVSRKGSKMERERADISKDFQKRAKEASEDLPEDSLSIISVGTPQFWHKTHTYENFVRSFKTNLEHHLESMVKYSGNKECKIFMVEYNDSALLMNKKVPRDLMLNVTYGDLVKRECPAYRLSRDIDLLQYIYEKKEQIDYLIFVDDNCFHGAFADIIKVSNSLEIIKLLHEGYAFHCAMVGSSESGIGVSVSKGKGDI